MRRGLTLVEVVAATALLTLIVLACVPLLRGARADLAAAGDLGDRGEGREFEAAVEELLRQRPALVELALDQPDGLEQRWAVGDQEFIAEVRVAQVVPAPADGRGSSHVWLVFAAAGVEIPRWALAPDLAEGAP